MDYSKLDEGFYNKNPLNSEKILYLFVNIFGSSKSVKVASYKYGLIFSILKCIEHNINKNRFSFEKIFTYFTSPAKK